MNRSVAAHLVIAGLLALGGCAQPARKQGYDAELGARIHSVVLAQAPNQQSFPVVRDWFIPPGGLGAIFLLAAAADIQISTERVTAALDAKQTRLQDLFSDMLRDGLSAQGYDTRLVVLPGADEPDALLPWLRQQGPADAALVVALKGSVGWPGPLQDPAAGSPAADFVPILTVAVQAIELASGAVLYREQFAYGRAELQSGAVYFAAEPNYGFASVAEMVADPARLRQGWMAGMRRIADRILADLKRKPGTD